VVTRDERGGGERVKSQPVTVGAKVGDLVRVDLAPGTRVVSAPGERLADGATVTAAKK